MLIPSSKLLYLWKIKVVEGKNELTVEFVPDETLATLEEIVLEVL